MRIGLRCELKVFNRCLSIRRGAGEAGVVLRLLIARLVPRGLVQSGPCRFPVAACQLEPAKIWGEGGLRSAGEAAPDETLAPAGCGARRRQIAECDLGLGEDEEALG